MKSLIRWSTTLGLVGSVCLSSLLFTGARALALTEDQIVEELRAVPVFAITDAEGAPLVAAPNEGQEGAPVAGVFISQADAQTFLTNLRENDPTLAGGVQVVPVSLAEVYQLALTSNTDQQTQIDFTFVPMEQEVESAVSLLQESGQNVSEFSGVPLFLARSSQEDGGYLTVRQDEQQVIPIFFKREELQAMLSRLQQEQPDLANNMVVQVINLENLIETLRTSDDPGLTQIQLVPPRESIDYIRSLQPESSGEQQQQQQQQ